LPPWKKNLKEGIRKGGQLVVHPPTDPRVTGLNLGAYFFHWSAVYSNCRLVEKFQTIYLFHIGLVIQNIASIWINMLRNAGKLICLKICRQVSKLDQLVSVQHVAINTQESNLDLTTLPLFKQAFSYKPLLQFKDHFYWAFINLFQMSTCITMQ
jgi:hypothetical protein